jgi:hypothetical protein
MHVNAHRNHVSEKSVYWDIAIMTGMHSSLVWEPVYGQNNSNACPRKMWLNLGQGATVCCTLPANAEGAV